MGLFRKKKRQEEPKLKKISVSGSTEGKKGYLRRLRAEKPWLFQGMVISLVCAVAFTSFYGVFRSRAEKYTVSPLENEENIAWLYQSCYLLYRDLCNAQSEEILDYGDIYLETDAGYEWILDEKQRQQYQDTLGQLAELSNLEEYVEGEELSEGWLAEAIAQGLVPEDQLNHYIEQGILDEKLLQEYENGENHYNLNLSECVNLSNEIEKMNLYFYNLEANFRDLNANYDYIIKDTKSGKYVTNMSVDDRNRGLDAQYFQVSFQFDAAGNVTIGEDISGRDISQVRKLANEAARVNPLQSRTEDNSIVFQRYGKVKMPVDCIVTFAVSRSAWEAGRGEISLYTLNADTNTASFVSYRESGYYLHAYLDSGLGGLLTVSVFFLVLLGIFLPLSSEARPWRDERICAVSLEALCCIACVLLACGRPVLIWVAYVADGQAGGVFSDYLGIGHAGADLIVLGLNLLILSLFYLVSWYAGICARALREMGVKRYIRQRSLIYRFFPFMKKKAVDAYEALAHMELTKDSNRTIIRILTVNAVILFLISCMWVGGFAVIPVYSIVLYFILKKYISELQKRYRILLKAVDEIAEGNLNVTIQEDLGVFEPFREQVFKIQEGLQKAVDTEVKSQRMKVELVTNMSHDLKTPLTAIITYVNLLKEKDITEEQRREYLATLESKSLRLKSLIEDLFEFSKASSQNVTLNIMDIDIMNLVKQVAFEMSDKIGEVGLDVRMNLTDEKVILPLDSQKTYRIYENLFGNIAKYALPGTRVYVNGFRIGDTVVITLKNISAQEITVDSSELTERFVRGDASRNTEGSGLGLAIAKSFMELQGGELHLEVDGDLFKVTTTWYMPQMESLSRGTPE